MTEGDPEIVVDILLAMLLIGVLVYFAAQVPDVCIKEYRAANAKHKQPRRRKKRRVVKGDLRSSSERNLHTARPTYKKPKMSKEQKQSQRRRYEKYVRGRSGIKDTDNSWSIPL